MEPPIPKVWASAKGREFFFLSLFTIAASCPSYDCREVLQLIVCKQALTDCFESEQC